MRPTVCAVTLTACDPPLPGSHRACLPVVERQNVRRLKIMFRLSVIGSICAFALTFCSYPLMLFRGALVAVGLYSGLIMAAAFAILLLGVTVKSTLDGATKKAPIRAVLPPVLALIFLYVAWWWLFVFWSRMP